MATNPYFRPYDTPSEQAVLDSLVQEVIQIHGLDIFYLPRKIFQLDELLTEDPQSYFDEAIPIDVYLKTFDTFQGAGNLMSQFGGVIADQLIFTVSQTTFNELVGASHDYTRPREGDLIWFPKNRKPYAINFVEKYPLLYPQGALYTFDMHCELFTYSGQKFSTGVSEIDAIEPALSQDLFDRVLTAEDGTPILTEEGNYIVPESYDEKLQDPLDDSTDIQRESDEFMTFTETDPYSEGRF